MTLRHTNCQEAEKALETPPQSCFFFFRVCIGASFFRPLTDFQPQYQQEHQSEGGQPGTI